MLIGHRVHPQDRSPLEHRHCELREARQCLGNVNISRSFLFRLLIHLCPRATLFFFLFVELCFAGFSLFPGGFVRLRRYFPGVLWASIVGIFWHLIPPRLKKHVVDHLRRCSSMGLP